MARANNPIGHERAPAGATVAGADFSDADLASARLVALVGLASARNVDKAKNLERAIRQ